MAPVTGPTHLDAVRIVVDDERCFLDGRPARYARTSTAALALLADLAGARIGELWLDHDLGGDDTIDPVVDELARAAFDGHPYDIDTVYVHTANASGAPRITRTLERWAYRCVRVWADDVGLTKP